MACSRVSVIKEFHKLLKNADKLYNGQVEFVLDDVDDADDVEDVDLDEDNDDANKTFQFYFYIKPKEGLYKNAKVKFEMTICPKQYPEKSPCIRCKTSILHPNIQVAGDEDGDGEVCVNLLEDDWEPSVGLDGTVMAVLFLFYHPDLEDCLSYALQYVTDYSLFESYVEQSLRGENLFGYSFDKLIEDDINSTENSDATVEDTTTSTTTKAIATSSVSSINTMCTDTASSTTISDTSIVKKDTHTGATTVTPGNSTTTVTPDSSTTTCTSTTTVTPDNFTTTDTSTMTITTGIYPTKTITDRDTSSTTCGTVHEGERRICDSVCDKNGMSRGVDAGNTDSKTFRGESKDNNDGCDLTKTTTFTKTWFYKLKEWLPSVVTAFRNMS